MFADFALSIYYVMGTYFYMLEQQQNNQTKYNGKSDWGEYDIINSLICIIYRLFKK